jgi:5-formyltetrahydrofolate cyclo-ligase
MAPENPKPALRRQVRERLKAMTQAQRAVLSERARARLQMQPVWQRARSVLFFAPLAEELDLWPLLAEALAGGKTVGLPRFSPEERRYIACRVRDVDQDIVTGRYGIREPGTTCPALPLKLDLLLVPGVAFDLHGRRLGRGQGFYDQLLAEMSGMTCGVAFDEQIVGTVPVEPHDVHLNCILTPTRWVEL